ncbi:hypothetical protein, partial [Hominenteromicrobium sp.]|uniref:hypothetical protein n=1 Tax=Hominenteromicrobium sp. TaxID=3073581 RepID=UPI003AF13802
DQEFLFQRIQVFRHKDELLSGRILTFMILHGQAFFYPSVSTFIIASKPLTPTGISRCAATFHCPKGNFTNSEGIYFVEKRALSF